MGSEEGDENIMMVWGVQRLPGTMATTVLLYISLKPDGPYQMNSVPNAQEVVTREAADSKLRYPPNRHGLGAQL